jgi:hypothetical protein
MAAERAVRVDEQVLVPGTQDKLTQAGDRQCSALCKATLSATFFDYSRTYILFLINPIRKPISTRGLLWSDTWGITAALSVIDETYASNCHGQCFID